MNSRISGKTSFLTYDSKVPWGVSPVPLVPAVLREHFGSELSPIRDKVAIAGDLLLADLDHNFWSLGIELTQENLRDVLTYCSSIIFSVANAPLVPKLLSKPVLTKSLALSRSELALIQSVFHSSTLSGHEIPVSRLLNSTQLPRELIVRLGCLLESGTPVFRGIANPATQPALSDDTSFLLGQDQTIDDNLPNSVRLASSKPDPALQQRIRSQIQEAHAAFASISSNLIPVLQDRLFAQAQLTPRSKLAQRLQIDVEEVKQLERLGRKQIAEIRLSPNYTELCTLTTRIFDHIGVAVPIKDTNLSSQIALQIGELKTQELQSFASSLMPHIADNYAVRQGWLLRRGTSFQRIENNLVNLVGDDKFLSEVQMRASLTKAEINLEYQSDFVSDMKRFVPIHGGYLFCHGTILDRVETLLRHYKRPFTIDEITSTLNLKNPRGTRFRMMADDRFWRINKQADFVLKGTGGFREYKGITPQIEAMVKETKGLATVDEIVYRVSSEFGVAANSVVVYINTPYFKVDPESKRVTLNSSSKEDTNFVPIELSGRCFRIDDTWHWRITINADWLRGSGRTCPNAFAHDIGIGPGQQERLKSEYGGVDMSWHFRNPSGANMGSLKKAVEKLELNTGDLLFVSGKDKTLQFKVIKKDTLDQEKDPTKRFGIEIGLSLSRNPKNVSLQSIAYATGYSPAQGKLDFSQLRTHLRRRGDQDLIQWLP